MVASWISWITGASVVFGLASACAWFYSSTVKITREQVVAQRIKEAERKGEKPNLAGATLDGWDMSTTFAAQAKWSSRGAVLAACAIALQAVGSALASV